MSIDSGGRSPSRSRSHAGYAVLHVRRRTRDACRDTARAANRRVPSRRRRRDRRPTASARRSDRSSRASRARGRARARSRGTARRIARATACCRMRGPSRICVMTRQHLTRIDRLDEIVADVAPSASRSVASSSLFVTITTGKVRRDLAHFAVGLEPALARASARRAAEVERPPPEQLDRVVGVGGRFDLVALLAKEDAVGLEELASSSTQRTDFGGGAMQSI